MRRGTSKKKNGKSNPEKPYRIDIASVDVKRFDGHESIERDASRTMDDRADSAAHFFEQFIVRSIHWICFSLVCISR
jgi:hypothetical protein